MAVLAQVYEMKHCVRNGQDEGQALKHSFMMRAKYGARWCSIGGGGYGGDHGREKRFAKPSDHSRASAALLHCARGSVGYFSE